ncbi:MAG: hypothetical protein QOC89_5472 [Paraburkholderia sp.]|nr:hypothetical protein [Paraburkholderia sp.]
MRCLLSDTLYVPIVSNISSSTCEPIVAFAAFYIPLAACRRTISRCLSSLSSVWWCIGSPSFSIRFDLMQRA